MSNELLPCPCCGEKAEEPEYIAYSVDGSFDYIGCSECGLLIPDGTHEEWNQRHIPEGFVLVPVEPEVQQLRGAQDQFGKFYGWGQAELRNAYKALIKAGRTP